MMRDYGGPVCVGGNPSQRIGDIAPDAPAVWLMSPHRTIDRKP